MAVTVEGSMFEGGSVEEAYREIAGRACFVCELLAGNPEFSHPVAYRDAVAVVFLSRFPWRLGHVLVAPVAHRSQVVADYTMAEYLGVQRVLHATGRALSEYVPVEQLHVSSLGGSHAHWNVAPVPPGGSEVDGRAAVDAVAMEALAVKLRPRIAWLLAAAGGSTPPR